MSVIFSNEEDYYDDDAETKSNEEVDLSYFSRSGVKIVTVKRGRGPENKVRLTDYGRRRESGEPATQTLFLISLLLRVTDFKIRHTLFPLEANG